STPSPEGPGLNGPSAAGHAPGAPVPPATGAPLLPATDQRGLTRVGTADIGAYEFSLAVDTTADVDNGNYAVGDLSLREAIKLANANPGADIVTFGGVFADANPDIIYLGSPLPNLTTDITIAGPGTNLLNVHRNTDPSIAFRIFTINSGVTAAISGLTLSNGFAGNGGGISNDGTLTLTNCTVNDNKAQFGGGILNSGTLKIT